MQTGRPSGITVLAIIEAVLGIFAIFGGTGHLLLGVAGGIVGFNGQDINLGTNGNLIYGYTFTIEGLVLLVTAITIWTRKKWSWTLAIAMNIIGLLTSIVVLAIGSALALPGVVVNLVVLFYLMRKPVKAVFGIGASGTATAK
jgi:hypothetical protein